MKAILIIILFHQSVGHLNSNGVGVSVSYLAVGTVEECERLGPKLAAQQRADAARLVPARRRIDVYASSHTSRAALRGLH